MHQYGIHVLLTTNLRQVVFDLRQHQKTSSHSKIDHAKTYNRYVLTYDGRVWQEGLEIESKVSQNFLNFIFSNDKI